MVIDFAARSIDGQGETVGTVTLKGSEGVALRNLVVVPGKGLDLLLVTRPKPDLTGPPR
jgi:hypothetical protein